MSAAARRLAPGDRARADAGPWRSGPTVKDKVRVNRASCSTCDTKRPKNRALKILRLTLPLMAQHRAAYHPQTYTLWYEHVAGINPRLSNELEQRVARRESLTDDDVWRLHANFVIARDAEALERMHQRLQSLLSDTATAASSAGLEATQFNQTLQLHKSQLTQPFAIDLITDIVTELITDTERMRIVTQELSEQLERSTQEAHQPERTAEASRASGQARSAHRHAQSTRDWNSACNPSSRMWARCTAASCCSPTSITSSS